MICFICKKDFHTIELLIRHFKRAHDIKTNSTLRCVEECCYQAFQDLGSFKRHCDRKHRHQSKKDSQINAQIATPQTETIIENNVSKTILENAKTKTLPEYNSNNDLSSFFKSASVLTLKLHSNHNFNRKDVYEIQKNIQQYIIDPLLSIMKSFSVHQINTTCPQIHNDFGDILSQCKNPFKLSNTDYLLFKWLKEEKLIEDPREFTIDESIDTVFRNGSLEYDNHKVKGIIMPLRFQFKKVFERKNMLANVLENIQTQSMNTNSVKNFVQGELWKKKREMYPGKQLIPYFLYNDEFEVNNPLGSHSGQHSVSNVYYSFSCLPEKESKLENIYLGAVIKSKDIKSFGNEKCWKTLVEELIDLEVTGVDISTENGIIRVHFILGLILGDNLGLNSFLNFNRSFVSTSFCRFCKMNKLQTHRASAENNSLMRSETNYAKDISDNISSESGIRKISLLNEIPSFHVVDNYSVDVMHDIFEGVCHYDLCHALNYFMETAKYFNLETLNSRKHNFEYGPIEIDNISGDITSTHLSKKHLKMSAREMMTFVYCFPLMVGDLVPEDDEVWKFILNFFEIIDIILCYEINSALIDLLSHKIATHNIDYVRLFNDTLKPKHHNLIHYPTVIKKSGPLKAFWCFKYESKHRQFKVYSHATTSRKNICLSLAKKYQLQFASSIAEPPINGSPHIINESDCTESCYVGIISSILKVSNESIQSFLKFKCNGYMFKNGFYVSVYKSDIEIYVILNIFMVDYKSISLFCQKLNMIQYNAHYLAYDIEPKQLGEFSVINIEDLVGPPLTKIKTSRGRTMIKVKEYYSANI